jgi:hypothetical protein
MNNGLGLIIESLVAVLLMLTIGYCIVLNSRLKRLKSDEQTLKATISELITATEIAERAIGGLKVTVRECDQGLGERLRTAERYSAELGRQLDAGKSILDRLTQIATATTRPLMPGAAPMPQAAPPETDTQAIVQAAQAFAARTRNRVLGVAA